MTGEWLPPKAPGADEPPPGPPPELPQQPAPGYWQPQQAPQPQQPPNNDAVAGFTCAIIGISLLFFSGGLSTIVSLILGVVAIPYSRKGKRNVEEGRTPKHKEPRERGVRDRDRHRRAVGARDDRLDPDPDAGGLGRDRRRPRRHDDPFHDFDSAVLIRVAAAVVRLVA